MNAGITMCLVLVLSVLAQAAKAADTDDCRPRLMGHVEAQVSDRGPLLLAGSLNGHDVWFELRTFDGFSLIREAAVTAVGLTATDLPKAASGGSRIASMSLDAKAGGKAIEHYVKMTDMKLGQIKIPGLEALVVPAKDEDTLPYYRDRPVAGTIGGKLFSVSDAEINLAEHRVSFFRQFECKGEPVYWGGEFTILPVFFDAAGSLMFPMELDGQKVDTSLVGGMRDTRLDEHVTRKFFGFDSSSPGVEKLPGVGGAADMSFKAMSLTAEGLNIRNTRIRLRPGSSCALTSRSDHTRAIGYSDCFNTVPMALGTDLLSQLRIYIASKQGKIYISKAATAAPSP
jgi:hypothetical protein